MSNDKSDLRHCLFNFGNDKRQAEFVAEEIREHARAEVVRQLEAACKEADQCSQYEHNLEPDYYGSPSDIYNMGYHDASEKLAAAIRKQIAEFGK